MDEALEIKRAFAHSLSAETKAKDQELLKLENQTKLIKVKVVALLRILEKVL